MNPEPKERIRQKEPDKLNITEKGKRRANFHQWLDDGGRNMLIHQIGRVQGLMEMCPSIEDFKGAARRQKTVSIGANPRQSKKSG